MHSNNEVGCLQAIADIVQLARQQNVLVHSDAAQSIGKVWFTCCNGLTVLFKKDVKMTAYTHIQMLSQYHGTHPWQH